jgi:hypothetical protein
MTGRIVSALRLALRSYREFYDRIWWMLLLTAVWWLLLTTIIFVPTATLLLFKHADPRAGVWDDRPDIRESGQILWSQLARGWLITVATVPLVGLMAFNMTYYGGGDSSLSFLAPIWLMLLILGITATITIFAVAGVTDLPAKEAIVTGARLAAMRLPAALMIVFVTALVPILMITSTYYVLLPIAVLIPGLVATAFSKFVLKAMGTAVPEPNQPTDERIHEKHSE